MDDEKDKGWNFEWIDIEWNVDDHGSWVPSISGCSDPELRRVMEERLTPVTVVDIDPQYLKKDGTLDGRRKRVPEEWQEEWK